MKNLVLSLLVFLQMNSAYAWGSLGHAKVAEIAWKQLTLPVQQKVLSLLNSGNDAPTTTCAYGSIDVAASWLDCVRNKGLTQEFANVYHADRIQLCPAIPIPSKCTTGHCASDTLVSAYETLKNSTSIVDRRIALKEILHLVGDLHQPLHAASGAEPVANGGSTNVRISASAPTMTLHEYWDIEVIKNIRTNQVFLDKIQASLPITEQFKGQLFDWTKETALEAGTQVYFQPLTPAMCDPSKLDTVFTLTPEYIKVSEHYAYFKIVQAGVRLGHVLNSALGGI